MRITGGQYRGRIIEPPKGGRFIRPTSDKVRQAIFNILNSRGLVDGAVVLDGFCGTGALGLEAISWGALCCTFMDKNRDSLELCKRNYAALKIDTKSSFILADCAKPGLKRSEIAAASLVFLDPPYGENLVPAALQGLTAAGWITPDAYILAETEKHCDSAYFTQSGYETVLRRDYGDTSISLLNSTP